MGELLTRALFLLSRSHFGLRRDIRQCCKITRNFRRKSLSHRKAVPRRMSPHARSHRWSPMASGRNTYVDAWKKRWNGELPTRAIILLSGSHFGLRRDIRQCCKITQKFRHKSLSDRKAFPRRRCYMLYFIFIFVFICIFIFILRFRFRFISVFIFRPKPWTNGAPTAHARHDRLTKKGTYARPYAVYIYIYIYIYMGPGDQNNGPTPNPTPYIYICTFRTSDAQIAQKTSCGAVAPPWCHV